MKKILAVLLYCFVIYSLPCNAQEKYSKVKIPITSSAVKQFAFANLNIDHYNMNGNAMEVVLNSVELNRLKNSNYAFELLIDDVVAHTIEVNSHPIDQP